MVHFLSRRSRKQAKESRRPTNNWICGLASNFGFILGLTCNLHPFPFKSTGFLARQFYFMFTRDMYGQIPVDKSSPLVFMSYK